MPRPGFSRKAAGALRRIGLVGCVKKKASVRRPAKDLYLSTLFRGRRSFVEGACDEWWILSAKHGLVHPDQDLEPYDATLKNASPSARRQWSTGVLAAIDERVRPVAGDVFQIHAGAEYRDCGLVDGLETRRCEVEVPTAGMGLGEQLRFYTVARGRRR